MSPGAVVVTQRTYERALDPAALDPPAPRHRVDRPATAVRRTAVEQGHRVETGASTAPAATPWVRIAVNAMASFVCVVVATLGLIVAAATLSGQRALVVTSDSMRPAIGRSDVVIASPPGTLAPGVGNVVEYERDGERWLHRVVQVTDGGVRTKGDANPTVDEGLVPLDQIRGIGIVVVPLLGLPRRWLDDGHHELLVAASVALGASAWMARKRWVTS